MSYFDTHQLERTNWRCSLNLYSFFEKKIVHGLFKKNSEYVVIWYGHKLTTEATNTFVEVKFVELTNPVYMGKDGEECQSFLIVKIPINYLHKIPFGSIWVNGESEQSFTLLTYTITITEDRSNLSDISLDYSKRNDEVHPFEFQEYVHINDINFFQWDKNQLLTIKQNKTEFVIHPLQFFIAHYGYSNEINRILSVYSWPKVEQKLWLNEDINTDSEYPVILPRNLPHKNAVFLHYLKYDDYTKAIVKGVNADILLTKKDSTETYKIPCWHNQAITLSFYGIPLGNSVLCTQITGISVPQGKAIDLVLAPKSVARNGKLSGNGNNVQYRTVKKEREHEIERLDVAMNPVNNLVTTSVIEQLTLIGQDRDINKIQDINIYQHSLDTRLVPYKDPTNFGVGAKCDGLGFTGLANCFYDVPNSEIEDDKSRLETVWEHATRLCIERGAEVCWYTPKCGFNDSDDFKLISLNEACKQLGTSYPSNALVIRIVLNTLVLYIISFPINKKGSGFSSVVYKPDNMDSFLNHDLYHEGSDTLVKLLVEIVSLNSIESDYVDSKNGKMTTFIHRPGANNNWVINGINKLK